MKVPGLRSDYEKVGGKRIRGFANHDDIQTWFEFHKTDEAICTADITGER
jgi:hypothetical protein